MAFYQLSSFNNNTGLGINEEELDDLQDQINTKFNISGGSITGEVDMTTNKIVNLGDATADTDALNRQTGDTRYLNVTGDTATGDINFTGGISINGTSITSTATELNLLDGATVTTAEINYNDITTLGEVEANKTVTADSSRNINNINVLETQYIQATANDEIYPASDLVFIGTEGTVGSSINFESSLIHTPGNYDYSVSLKDDVTLSVRGTGGTEILNINDTNVNVKNDLVVTGDMYVNGTATYINTTSLQVEDNLIMMGKDNTTTDITDLGWIAPYYDSGAGAVRYASLFRDASDGEFYIQDSIVGEPSTTITSGSLANFNCGSISVGTNINGVSASYYDPTSSIQTQLDDKISETTGLTQDLALNDFNLTCSGSESSYLLTSGTGTVGLSGGNNGYCWVVSTNEVAGAVRISAIGGLGVNNTIQLQAGDGASTLKMEIGATEIDITNCDLNLNSNPITNVSALNGISSTTLSYLDATSSIQSQLNSCLSTTNYTQTLGVNQDWGLNVYDNGLQGLIVKNTYVSGLADIAITAEAVTGGTDAIFTAKTGTGAFSFGLKGGSPNTFVLSNQDKSLSTPMLEFNPSSKTIAMNDYNLTATGTEDLYMLTGGTGIVGLSGGISGSVQLASGKSSTTAIDIHSSDSAGGINLKVNSSTKVNVNNTTVDITNATLDMNTNLIDNASGINVESNGNIFFADSTTVSGIRWLDYNHGMFCNRSINEMYIREYGTMYFQTLGSNTRFSISSTEVDTFVNLDMNGKNINNLGTMTISSSNAGSDNKITIENTSTTTGSGAMLELKCNPASNNTDAFIYFHADGETGWSMGMDCGDSNNFKLCPSTTSGGVLGVSPDVISINRSTYETTLNYSLSAHVPHITLTKSTDQSISNNTQTLVTWNDVKLNRGFSFTSGNSAIPAPEDGLYQVNYHVAITHTTSGISASWIETSNTTDYATRQRFGVQYQSPNDDDNLHNGSFTLNLASSDTVTIYTYQNGGFTENLRGTNVNRCYISITKIGAKI